MRHSMCHLLVLIGLGCFFLLTAVIGGGTKLGKAFTLCPTLVLIHIHHYLEEIAHGSFPPWGQVTWRGRGIPSGRDGSKWLALQCYTYLPGRKTP